jgi:hypothetical protein
MKTLMNYFETFIRFKFSLKSNLSNLQSYIIKVLKSGQYDIFISDCASIIPQSQRERRMGDLTAETKY